MRPELSPDRLLAAYSVGIFPMADETGRVIWLAPDPRAIIDLDGFKVPRSLRTVLRRGVFTLTVDKAFPRVIDACSHRSEGTWISDEIKRAYGRLHRLGFAHSVEAWNGTRLAGGLYGVALGGAFFGESMFHRISDASKVALVHLVERLKARGFILLDVQFMTEHLRRFGAIEIPATEYARRLKNALRLQCTWADSPKQALPKER